MWSRMPSSPLLDAEAKNVRDSTFLLRQPARVVVQEEKYAERLFGITPADRLELSFDRVAAHDKAQHLAGRDAALGSS